MPCFFSNITIVLQILVCIEAIKKLIKQGIKVLEILELSWNFLWTWRSLRREYIIVFAVKLHFSFYSPISKQVMFASSSIQTPPFFFFHLRCPWDSIPWSLSSIGWPIGTIRIYRDVTIFHLQPLCASILVPLHSERLLCLLFSRNNWPAWLRMCHVTCVLTAKTLSSTMKNHFSPRVKSQKGSVH